MEKRYIRELAKKALKKFRIEVRRLPRKGDRSGSSAVALPPLFDEPLEALAYNQVGGNAAFKCPLKYTIKLNGLSYGPTKWHPFVETIKEYIAGKTTTYKGSILEAYYQEHKPENAAEAIVGFEHAPAVFQNLPAQLYRLSPWRLYTAEQVDKS